MNRGEGGSIPNAEELGQSSDELSRRRIQRKETSRLGALSTKISDRLTRRLATIEKDTSLSAEEKQSRLFQLTTEMNALPDLAADFNTVIQRVEEEGEIDSISGLVKIAAFREFYELAMEYLSPNEEVVVVAFDLDKFKIINDTIGHDRADLLLGQIGKILLTHLRPDDRACRIGGDEFVLFLNHVKLQEREQVVKETLKVLSRVSELIYRDVAWKKDPNDPNEKESHVSLSIGCAESGAFRKPFFDKLRGVADGASIASKHAGRNRVTFINPKGEYETYCFNAAKADASHGVSGYEFDQVVDIKTANKSLSSCEAEVNTSLQRVKEEIENFISLSGDEVLGKLMSLKAPDFSIQTRDFLQLVIENRQSIDWNDMKLKEIVHLLYIVRAIKD